MNKPLYTLDLKNFYRRKTNHLIWNRHGEYLDYINKLRIVREEEYNSLQRMLRSDDEEIVNMARTLIREKRRRKRCK